MAVVISSEMCDYSENYKSIALWVQKISIFIFWFGLPAWLLQILYCLSVSAAYPYYFGTETKFMLTVTVVCLLFLFLHIHTTNKCYFQNYKLLQRSWGSQPSHHLCVSETLKHSVSGQKLLHIQSCCAILEILKSCMSHKIRKQFSLFDCPTNAAHLWQVW